MGLSFAQVVEELRRLQVESPSRTKIVDVVLATNQDNGIVSYSGGRLVYSASVPNGGEGLLTPTGDSQEYLFSDRFLNLPTGGVFGGTPQPFSVRSADRIALRLGWFAFDEPTLSVTLLSWGGGTFSVPVRAFGNLLAGTGPPIGNGTENAVYLVSFTNVAVADRPV